jgi:dUTP pyrophosphatase
MENRIVRHFPIKIKRLNENAVIPTHGSDAAAGYDLYSCLDKSISIPPHETVKIGTGLAMSIPNNCWGAIYPRSGISSKLGLRPANCVGVIDPDYRGEIIVAIHNDSHAYQIIYPGDRIAQFILRERFLCDWEEVEELDDTERGDGGFGSTGK